MGWFVKRLFRSRKTASVLSKRGGSKPKGTVRERRASDIKARIEADAKLLERYVQPSADEVRRRLAMYDKLERNRKLSAYKVPSPDALSSRAVLPTAVIYPPPSIARLSIREVASMPRKKRRLVMKGILAQHVERAIQSQDGYTPGKVPYTFAAFSQKVNAAAKQNAVPCIPRPVQENTGKLRLKRMVGEVRLVGDKPKQRRFIPFC